MSPNRRIFLNIIATYGRSLYALVCGLFIGRWALAALGKSDLCFVHWVMEALRPFNYSPDYLPAGCAVLDENNPRQVSKIAGIA